jgi:hypothetical protein
MTKNQKLVAKFAKIIVTNLHLQPNAGSKRNHEYTVLPHQSPEAILEAVRADLDSKGMVGKYTQFEIVPSR